MFRNKHFFEDSRKEVGGRKREKEKKGRLRGKKGKEKEFSIFLEPLLLCCFL